MRFVLPLLVWALCAVTASALTVTAPNGGELFMRGGSNTITWTSSAGGNVRIELLRNGTLYSTITGSTANSGTYSWTYFSTQQPAGDYRIRITSTSNSAETDTSDGDFCVSTNSSLGSMMLNATAQKSPPQITITWPAWTARVKDYTIYRRNPGETSWGAVVATLPPSATSYIDTSVAVGTVYEYRVTRNATLFSSGYGYIHAGIEAPLVENRGKLVLVVDNTVATPLALELNRLIRDLVGDGWQVIRHDVSRTATVPSVKALIKGTYDADPTNVKAVLLFGHVPVPYSGQIAPDGHPDHSGAWAADNYYGDMDGVWTDTTVNTTAASRAQNDNVPGDGKFDQSNIPSDVELAVGRVDLASMDAFALNEVELLRQYLTKVHHYRRKLLTAQTRTLVDDEFNFSSETGWRSGASLTGIENVFARDWNTTLASNDYLFAIGGGGGTYTSASGVTTTNDLALRDHRAIFTGLFGSYFADWDSTNNLLRAPLATSMGLTCFWSGRPGWEFHPMSMGEPIGFSYRLNMNNTGFSNYNAGAPSRSVHMALMGDPTLRLHVVAPPSNVVLNGQTLSWSASPDAEVLGYHVYRSASETGPFTRLNTNLLAATSFEDPAGGAGFTYMVRAVKLEISPTGSYFNASQGAFFNPAPVASAVFVTPRVKTVLTAGTQQFSAEVVDQFGYAMNPQPASFAWSVTGRGDVNGSGLFTGSTTTGFATVSASSGGFTGSATVTVYPPPGTGTGVTEERWDGPTGTTVDDLRNLAEFPNFPTSRSMGANGLFEAFLNVADNYGRRMRGIFTAPVTGEYRFLISSDDYSELWVSNDTNPNNSSLVASVTGNTTARQWNKYASQRSGVITLTAGQQCYVEALHKDATGSDNLAVGVELPGGVPDRPIPANRLTPFAGWVPAPWTQGEVGATTSSLNSYAFAEYQPRNGTYVLKNAGGAAIGGTVDAFRFVRQGMSGDLVITAKVTGLLDTNADAKAGVMIRESLNANAPYVGMFITDANGANFQGRSSVGSPAAVRNVTGITAPYWVRLERLGNRVRGYISADGINNWTQVGGDAVLSATNPVFVGLAATSSSTSLGTATLSNVSVIPLTPLESWRAKNNFPINGTGIGADTADPDNDGIPNLLEYAFGLFPKVADAEDQPLTSIAGGRLAITFQRNPALTDISYTVEVSSSLAPNGWTAIARSVAGGVTSNLGGAFSVNETGTTIRAVTVEDAVPVVGTEQRFIRVKVGK